MKFSKIIYSTKVSSIYSIINFTITLNTVHVSFCKFQGKRNAIPNSTLGTLMQSIIPRLIKQCKWWLAYRLPWFRWSMLELGQGKAAWCFPVPLVALPLLKLRRTIAFWSRLLWPFQQRPHRFQNNELFSLICWMQVSYKCWIWYWINNKMNNKEIVSIKYLKMYRMGGQITMRCRLAIA